MDEKEYIDQLVKRHKGTEELPGFSAERRAITLALLEREQQGAVPDRQSFFRSLARWLAHLNREFQSGLGVIARPVTGAAFALSAIAGVLIGIQLDTGLSQGAYPEDEFMAYAEEVFVTSDLLPGEG